MRDVAPDIVFLPLPLPPPHALCPASPLRANQSTSLPFSSTQLCAAPGHAKHASKHAHSSAHERSARVIRVYTECGVGGGGVVRRRLRRRCGGAAAQQRSAAQRGSNDQRATTHRNSNKTTHARSR